MKTQKNTDRIDKKMYIVTVISVLFAALTFLFGSGVVSRYYLSDTPSSPAKGTVPNAQDVDGSNATGTSVILGSQANILGEIEEITNLGIDIESVIVADDGFYYEYPDTNESINMEKLVVIGTFAYSKDLNEKEKREWSHSGELRNSDGEICYSDKTSFWSDYETGQFSIDLPEEIEEGKYTCIINHYIDGYVLSAAIQLKIY